MPFRISQIVLAVLLGCCGCSTVPKINPKAEIQSVLAQRQALKTTFIDPNKSRKKPEYYKYVPEIKRIDVSRCPSEFQQTWFDYVVALEQAHAHDRDADWEGLGKVLGAVAAVQTGGAALVALPGLASPTSNSRLKKQLFQRLEDAWFKLERICLNYGVAAER